MRAAMTPQQADPRPQHHWLDPDEDGHNCALCPEDSMWKCDRAAHPLSPYGLLTDEQRAALDEALRDDAKKRRMARAAAARMWLS